MNIEIFCLDNSELAEFEASNKGHRSDIYVKIKESFFNLNIYSIVRLQQDFESEFKLLGYYMVEPNLILVDDVTSDSIRFIIETLFRKKYFNAIKPLENDDPVIKKIILFDCMLVR